MHKGKRKVRDYRLKNTKLGIEMENKGKTNIYFSLTVSIY